MKMCTDMKMCNGGGGGPHRPTPSPVAHFHLPSGKQGTQHIQYIFYDVQCAYHAIVSPTGRELTKRFDCHFQIPQNMYINISNKIYFLPLGIQIRVWRLTTVETQVMQEGQIATTERERNPDGNFVTSLNVVSVQGNTIQFVFKAPYQQFMNVYQLLILF